MVARLRLQLYLVSSLLVNTITGTVSQSNDQEVLALSSEVNNDNFVLAITLSSTYGAASIQDSDGRQLDIVKIDGGRHYSRYMAALQEPREEAPSRSSQWPILDKIKAAADRLWRYWSQPSKNDSTSLALLPMISALCKASDAVLERPWNMTAVSVSLQLVDSLAYKELDDQVQRILVNLGQKGFWRVQDSMQAVAFMGGQGRCSNDKLPDVPDDPPRNLLMVENSRDSLEVAVLEEECGLLEYLSGARSHELGQTALEQCRATRGEECYLALVAHLRAVIDNASYRAKAMDNVILFGEGAEDDLLNKALRQVLSETAVHGDGARLKRPKDPNFIAPRMLAYLAACTTVA